MAFRYHFGRLGKEERYLLPVGSPAFMICVLFLRSGAGLSWYSGLERRQLIVGIAIDIGYMDDARDRWSWTGIRNPDGYSGVVENIKFHSGRGLYRGSGLWRRGLMSGAHEVFVET